MGVDVTGELASPLFSEKSGEGEAFGVRCSLWQHRNAAKRVERGRTSIVAGVRADVVLERKRQGCGSTVGGDRPLRRRTEQRARVKRATTGRRVIDGDRAHRDLGQVAISSLRPGHSQSRKNLVDSSIVLESDRDFVRAERLGSDADR